MSSSSAVYLHIGLPKTGTTFLQHALAANRSELLKQGLIYPGERDDHFFPVQDVMQHRFRGHLDERAAGTWDATVEEVSQWTGNALISHELMARASADQIATIVKPFADREIHLVVTVRDVARQLPAVWQEEIKNGKTLTLETFVEKARASAAEGVRDKGFWAFQNLPGILQTWRAAVPAERVHIVTVPPRGSDPSLLIARFSEAVSLTTLPTIPDAGHENISLGMAEVEFLRRLNEQVFDRVEWPEYRQHVKQFLVRRALGRGQQSQPISLTPADLEWATEQSHEIVRAIGDEGYQLHGSLERP